MKLRKDCRITGLRDKYLLVIPYGKEERNLEVNAGFNDIWEAFAGRNFTLGDVSDHLCKEYGMEPEKAAAEASDIIGLWKEYGLTEQ